MPRDSGTGIYSTPVGTDGIPNRTISSTAYNLNVHDVETDLNTPRPIIAGGTGASDAATALKNLGAMPLHDIGQCYLSKASGTAVPLTLKPENGNLLWINGKIETIPDAGLTLASTGNIANTFYYIYAYMNSGVMTLEYSTTAYAVQAVTNVKIKSGDPTRTLVGIARAYTSNATWSSSFTDVCSLFNPKDKTFISPNTTNGTTSTTMTQLSAVLDLRFVTFSDREVVFRVFGAVNQSTNAAAVYLDAILDFSTPYLFVNLHGMSPRSQPGTAAVNNEDWMFAQISFFTSETQGHIVTPGARVSAGTLSFTGNSSVTIKG